MVPPGPNLLAQWLFLDAVRRCVPEALSELAAIAPSLPDDSFNRGTWDQEAPLRAWCERFGFTTAPEWKGDRDWLLTVARGTAVVMRYTPLRAPAEFEWLFEPSYRKLKTETVASLRWNLAEETEALFRGRVETYIGQVKAAAGERGWTEAPEKRKLEQHMEWLALYQVGGRTEAEIATLTNADGENPPDVSTISRAITETARLIGLRLRPAQGRAKP